LASPMVRSRKVMSDRVWKIPGSEPPGGGLVFVVCEATTVGL